MSNILNLKTGEPFDPLPRLHHRPETSLAVSSSVNSARARGMLLAAKSFYIGGNPAPSIPWVDGVAYDRNGRIFALDGWSVIDELIPIDGSIAKVMEVKYSNSSGNGSAFLVELDANGAMIDYWGCGTYQKRSFTVRIKTRYVKVSIATSCKDDFYVKYNGEFVLKGSNVS